MVPTDLYLELTSPYLATSSFVLINSLRLLPLLSRRLPRINQIMQTISDKIHAMYNPCRVLRFGHVLALYRNVAPPILHPKTSSSTAFFSMLFSFGIVPNRGPSQTTRSHHLQTPWPIYLIVVLIRPCAPTMPDSHDLQNTIPNPFRFEILVVITLCCSAGRLHH